MAGAADSGAAFPGIAARGRDGRPMVSITRFGRKLKLPSVIEIKHQLLTRWLADQIAKEAAETKVPDGADRANRRTT